MKFLKYISLVTLFVLLIHPTVSAQYYSWGNDSDALRWKQIKDDRFSIIFPDSTIEVAQRMHYYLSQVSDKIGYTYSRKTMKIPFVVHPNNLNSNGLTMWAPKRIEYLSAPIGNDYSVPWIKQLAVHEYRHAAQYTNLRRGFLRVGSWFAGEQIMAAGLGLVPIWGLEGDAVWAETQMSTYGRGLQPSFTIRYRTLAEELKNAKNLDKYFCGSYKQVYPDHYALGYQITSYANNKYKENIWDRLIPYTARNIYMIVPRLVATKRFYKTTVTKLVRETLNDLADHWEKPNKVDDSFEYLSVKPSKYHTKYSYPTIIDDTHILYVHSDLVTTSELVIYNTETQKEEVLCKVGNISGRPVVYDGKAWWSEIRPSHFYEQKTVSVICYKELYTKHKASKVNWSKNAFFPTVTPNGIAYVEYSPSGKYTIVDNGSRLTLPVGIEIHGMAYDNSTGNLYVITTTDDGMGIEKITDKGLVNIKPHAYITLSDLTAKDGTLYFGSILTGKDEVHSFCLASSEERCISTSRFGSFNPCPVDENTVYMVSCNKDGYLPSVQKISQNDTIGYRKIPFDVVNPRRLKWSFPNVDTMRFVASRDTVESNKKTKRYSKVGHLLKIHSWAPFSYDPFGLLKLNFDNLNYGITLMSQNLLSTMEASASYGWSPVRGHLFFGKLTYMGLPLKFDFNFDYGGKQDTHALYAYQFHVNLEDPDESRYVLIHTMPREKLRKQWEISFSAYLPFHFNSSNRVRSFTMGFGYNYSNDLVPDTKICLEDGKPTEEFFDTAYKTGLHLLQGYIRYSNMTRTAQMDFMPRWGHSFSLVAAGEPTNPDFGKLISAYGKIYLPGPVRLSYINLAATYQNSFGGLKSPYIYSSLMFNLYQLLPRGYYSTNVSNRNYFATSLNVSFPLCHPDGGIPSVLYFKRIRMNLGFDYASYEAGRMSDKTILGEEEFAKFMTVRKNVFSYGADLTLDMNIFRAPASGTTSLTLSLYKPTTLKGVFFGVKVGLPF